MGILFKRLYMHVIPEHVFFPLLLWSTVIYFGPNRVFENYQSTVSHNDKRQDIITATNHAIETRKSMKYKPHITTFSY
jgi:hypothetical protein